MPVAARSIPDPTAESEAFQALLLLAERRTGRIPPDRLVRHVLSVTALAGWPVQRAALEAALRRLSAAKQDGLVVATAPSSGLGVFTTRRKGSHARPYKILLEEIEPLRATCDCRDFVRNSLGLCKHVLTVLAEQSATLKKLGTGRTRLRPPRVPRLAWDPIRPLVGLGDWMERVRLVEPSNGAGTPATGSLPHEYWSAAPLVRSGGRLDYPARATYPSVQAESPGRPCRKRPAPSAKPTPTMRSWVRNPTAAPPPADPLRPVPSNGTLSRISTETSSIPTSRAHQAHTSP